MVNQFMFVELLLYIVPVLTIYKIKNKYNYVLKSIKGWPLNLAIILIPMWMVLIRSFSVLIFGYSLLNLSVFLTTYVLIVDLYFYIRKIESFHFKDYYKEASMIIFLTQSAFLFSLVVLRIITYFI